MIKIFLVVTIYEVKIIITLFCHWLSSFYAYAANKCIIIKSYHIIISKIIILNYLYIFLSFKYYNAFKNILLYIGIRPYSVS